MRVNRGAYVDGYFFPKMAKDERAARENAEAAVEGFKALSDRVTVLEELVLELAKRDQPKPKSAKKE